MRIQLKKVLSTICASATTLLLFTGCAGASFTTTSIGNKTTIEAKDAEGGTPIFCAILNPSTVMLKALIDAGADTDCNDNDGISVLIYAIISLANGHTTLNHIKLLIDNMSYFDNFDINGATAMIYAAQLVDYPEVVKMLIDAGADLTEEDFDGHTALDWAIHVHNSAAVSMLSARGARRNL